MIAQTQGSQLQHQKNRWVRGTFTAEHQQHADFCATHPQRAALGERLGGWRQQFEQRHKLQQAIATQQLALQALQDEQAERSRKLTAQSAVVDTEAQAKAESESAHQSAQAEQDQRLAGKTPAELRTQWQAEQGHVNRWQQLEAGAKQRRELATQKVALAAEVQQGETTVTEQTAKLLALREQYKAIHEQVVDKQRLLDQERRIQSLDAHRLDLQPGDACPLCGSVERKRSANDTLASLKTTC